MLHARPAERWTLERLAEAVTLSRSALADRFTHLVGQPPMQYLTRWRLQLAARRLTDGQEKVAAVASAVGYAATHRDFVLSDQLFWFDGEVWSPIPVRHGDDDITVLPTPAFVAMMRKLASMDLVSVAGEA